MDAASGAAAARIDPDTFIAVFAANDKIALVVMSVLGERGLTAPDDYSIVGLNNVPEARYLSPPLAIARLERVGETAVSALLDLARGHDAPSQIVSSSVSIRRSTRAVNAGAVSSREMR